MGSYSVVPSWPESLYVDYAGLEFAEVCLPLESLGLKEWVTMMGVLAILA